MLANGTLGSVLRAVAVAASVALFVGAGVLERPRATGRTMHGTATRHRQHSQRGFSGKAHVRHVPPGRASGWIHRDLRHPEKPSALQGQLTNLETQVGLHPERVVRALAP
jgi:hypothetical protein